MLQCQAILINIKSQSETIASRSGAVPATTAAVATATIAATAAAITAAIATAAIASAQCAFIISLSLG